MSEIDAEPHSLLFSFGASFGVLSSQNFNPANSKVHSFQRVPVGNSNVQAVRNMAADPPNGQQIVTLST